jgi:hypothetical protein
MIFHFYTYTDKPINSNTFDKLDLFVDIPLTFTNSDSALDSDWIESLEYPYLSQTKILGELATKAIGEVDDKLSQMGLTPDTRYAFRISREEVKVNIKPEYFNVIKTLLRDKKLNELLS